VELTFPGKQAVVVCEVLTKTSSITKNDPGLQFAKLSTELDIVVSKIKPFFHNRSLMIRLTSLDGLMLQNDIKKLQSHLSESLGSKTMGTGLLPLSIDLVRVICLSTQIPVAGLLVRTFLALAKKSPSHRNVFDYLDLVFQEIWSFPTQHRRLRGLGMQVKGRYNISNDRSQRWNIR
jgi:hypothetical protein